MSAYTVRVDEPALRAWLKAEAKRQRIRVADLAANAVRHYRAFLEGSRAPTDRGSGVFASEEVPAPAADPLRGGDASDHGAAPADAVAGQAVVQSVPAGDPNAGVDAQPTHYNVVVTSEDVSEGAPRIDVPEGGIVIPKGSAPRIVIPAVRPKGPDSGPDDELGF